MCKYVVMSSKSRGRGNNRTRLCKLWAGKEEERNTERSDARVGEKERANESNEDCDAL